MQHIVITRVLMPLDTCRKYHHISGISGNRNFPASQHSESGTQRKSHKHGRCLIGAMARARQKKAGLE
jgi:hypothetical protein